MESVIGSGGGNINRGQECRQWQYGDYIGTFVSTAQVTISQILHFRQLIMCREISVESHYVDVLFSAPSGDQVVTKFVRTCGFSLSKALNLHLSELRSI